MRRRALSLAMVALLGAAGCSSFAQHEEEAPAPTTRAQAPSAGQARTSPPDDRLTVLADTDPVGTAVGASVALFDEAPVVVLARADDASGTLLGAATAVGLGAPLLVEPADPAAGDPVAAELDRLGAETVLAVGTPDVARVEDGGAYEVVGLPADPDAVSEVTGLAFDAADPVPAGEEAAAVAALDPEAPALLRPEGAEEADGADGADGAADGGGPDAGPVPVTTPPEPLEQTLVLATGGPESLAALATARAAGARVLVTGGATDPRGSAEVLDAVAEAAPETVVALGAAFAGEEGLDWKVETALTGEQLPGGGQLLFPGRLLVALYGHPGTPSLGVLGEQGLDASITRARDHAAPYEDLTDDTVVPTFEIIATVASSAAGPDGNYSAEAAPEDLRPWVEAAGEAGLYVLLDLQPGRTDFLTQAQRYQSLLELPHVGLALDPEWRLGPNDVHLTAVGSVGVDEVNGVITWLADLTREHALPQKLLVLHQFRTAMLPGRERLDLSRDELAVMVHADGQGAQGDKQATWRTLRQGASPDLFWGWKNFYDEDLPMLTPEQTWAQVSPVPQLISYQ